MDVPGGVRAVKSWHLGIAVVVVISLVGGAGYLGARGATPRPDPTPQAPTTVAVTRGDVQQIVTAPGTLVSTKQMTLAAQVAGQIAEINVRPGDLVHAGDVVAHLDAAPLERALEEARIRLEQAQAERVERLDQARAEVDQAVHQLEQARTEVPSAAAAEAALAAARTALERVKQGPEQAEILDAQAALARLKNGPSQESVREAELAVEQAKNSLWSVQIERDGTCGNPMMPRHQCEAANARVAAAETALATAQNNLAKLHAPPPPEDVAAAEARLQALTSGPAAEAVAEAEARVQQAQAEYDRVLAQAGAAGNEIKHLEAEVERARAKLKRLEENPDPLPELEVKTAEANLAAATLRSPMDGVVLEVKVRRGDSVQTGSAVAVLADPKALEAEAQVIEEDLPLVKEGQPSEIFLDAAPDAETRGKVRSIVPSRIPGDRPLYPVYVSLDDVPDGLAPGMSLDVNVITEQRQDVLRLPRALVRGGASGTGQVRVWANGTIENRTVKLGLRGKDYVEIVEGLGEGDQVVAQ